MFCRVTTFEARDGFIFPEAVTVSGKWLFFAQQRPMPGRLVRLSQHELGMKRAVDFDFRIAPIRELPDKQHHSRRAGREAIAIRQGSAGKADKSDFVCKQSFVRGILYS